MTTPGHRALARKVLAHHAGSEAVAAAARRAYDDLVPVLASLIGQAGVDALTGRALHLVRRDYPWLAEPQDPEMTKNSFAHVVTSMEREDPVMATEAARAVFATLTGLLVTFIGESLTAGLLKKAWPHVFADGNPGDTHA